MATSLGLWHERLLRYEGTNPEINNQIKANILMDQVERNFEKTGQAPQFYANAIANYFTALYYTPLGWTEGYVNTAFRFDTRTGYAELGAPKERVLLQLAAAMPSPTGESDGRHTVRMKFLLNDSPSGRAIKTCEIRSPAYTMLLKAKTYVFVLSDPPSGWNVNTVASNCIDWLTEMLTDDSSKTLTDDTRKCGLDLDPISVFIVVLSALTLRICAMSEIADLPERAIQLGKLLLTKDPSYSKLHYTVARLYGKTGQMEEAFQMALKENLRAEEKGYYYCCMQLNTELALGIRDGGCGAYYNSSQIMACVETAFRCLKQMKHWLPTALYQAHVARWKSSIETLPAIDTQHKASKPVRAVLMGKLAHHVSAECDCCGEGRMKLMKCSGCGESFYCSVECQKKAWPEHKKVCARKKNKSKPEEKKKSSNTA